MPMKAKYDTIGGGYNSTRKADPYLASRMFALLAPDPDGTYLDIGCGTGNYTTALHNLGTRFIGIDPSEKMLERAREQTTTIKWKLGTADHIDLPDHSMDGVLATLTLHHWPNLTDGFQELRRVLKPRSKLVIFTSTPAQMEGYWLTHYFPKMLADSRVQMPTESSVVEALQTSGFSLLNREPYAVRPDLQDHFLYVGKAQPELYLNPQVRNGISSFSALSNREEVETGLAQLKADLDTGEWEAIRDSYSNETGDYLFLVAST